MQPNNVPAAPSIILEGVEHNNWGGNNNFNGGYSGVSISDNLGQLNDQERREA